MKGFWNRWRLLQTPLFGLGLLLTVGLTGCQVDVGGQTLPSPYYLQDDVQYFPPGPEFLFAREAAAMKAYGAPSSAAPGQLGPAPGQLPPAPGQVVPAPGQGMPMPAQVPPPVMPAP
jgi:hypothetical protein